MAAMGEFYFFVGAKTIQKSKSEIIEILRSHYMYCVWKCAGDFTVQKF